jgi:hypothetical protein
MPLAAGEGKEHLENERLQGEMCVDVFAAGAVHGARIVSK